MNTHDRTRVAILASAVIVSLLSLACGTLAPSMPRNPTPLPLSDLRVVELGTEVLIEDSAKGEAVGIGQNGEIYLVTVATGEKRQLTNDGHHKWSAVISAEYVAWLDQRRKLELPGSTSRTPLYATDIFLLERRSGEVRRITDEPASRSGLQISGSRLVWQSGRNLGKERYPEFDIYAYEITSGREFPIAMATNSHAWPAIHGQTVVWADNRDSPVRGTGKSGCTNCADNQFDIYAYDFTTDEEALLVASGKLNYAPSIHGPYVVWQEFYEAGKSRIKLLDRATGEQRTLGEGGRTPAMSAVSDEYVVWSVREACDVVGPDTGRVQTGVFAYNLNTDEVRQLSNYIEPHAWLHNNVVLIQEGCHVISRVYAVYLN